MGNYTVVKTILLQVRVSPELKKAIEHIAVEKQTSVSALASKLISDYVVSRESEGKKKTIYT